MSDSTPTSSAPPPSSLTASPARLLKSTLIAALIAGVLLVTVVLPAEHGIDPTGVGRMLGLTQMGEIKVTLAQEAAAESQAAAESAPTPEAAPAPIPEPIAEATPASAVQATAPSLASNSHVTEVVLASGQGKEIKLVMRKDARVTYAWSTDRGVVNFDAHADGPGIKYHGYEKGFAKPSGEGVLVAAFDGSHGWFFRNRGTETVTVTLRTEGDYEELKRL